MSRTVICIPRISVDITGTFVAEKKKNYNGDLLNI